LFDRLHLIGAVFAILAVPALARGRVADPVDSSVPMARIDPAEQAVLAQAIGRQLKPFWSPPSGEGAERLVTLLSWELNPDGSLKAPPRVVSQEGVDETNRALAPLHAQRAIRAVESAAPFDLPAESYNIWKRIGSWRFDRRL
jgi:hypothetical protein